MSVVYEATKAGRAYALKWMKPTADAVSATLRFRREGAALARLTHPSLVRIHEVGVHEQRPYLVMELVAGEELAARIRRGALAEADAAKLGAILADGLDEVHRRGLVHRDIKPQNILMSSSGGARLIDFGFVKPTDEWEGAEMVGTVHYGSPEQLGLISRNVGPASDLYSLGVVLFEAVSGRLPLDVDDVNTVLQQRATSPAPDLRRVAPQISPAFSAIVAKLLSTDPDDRYQSARGLAKDLGRLAELNALPSNELKEALDREPGHSSFTAVEFVGRLEELGQVRAVLQLAETGAGAVCLVMGEGGSGKTRLCEEAVRRSSFNSRSVARAKCQQGERVPYGPLRHALDSYLTRARRTSPDQLSALADALGDSAAVIKNFSPGTKALLSGLADPTPLEANRERERFQSGVARLLETLARVAGGLILWIDDVQWIDAGSREILARVAAGLSDVPLALLSTGRDDPESRSVVADFESTLPQERVTKISLGPLSLRASEELLQAYLGGGAPPEGLASRLHSAAQGNVFAIGEYLRALIEEGQLGLEDGRWVVTNGNLASLALSKDIIELVLARAERLSVDARHVLAVAAVLGSEFEAQHLEAVVDVAKPEVARAIEEASSASLLETISEQRHRFMHDRVREAFLAALDEERAAATHQRVAQWLDERQSEDPELTFAIARHYASGEPHKNPRRVFETSLMAGILALENHAQSDAYEFLQVARDIVAQVPDVDVTEEFRLQRALGEAALGALAPDRALEHLERALQICATPFDVAQIRALMARTCASAGNSTAAIPHVREGLKAVGASYPTSKPFQFLAMLAVWLGAVVSSVLGLTRAVEGDEQKRRILIADLYSIGTLAAYLTGHLLLFIQFLLRQLSNGQRLGQTRQGAEAYASYGTLLAVMKMRGRSLAAIERGEAMSENLGDQFQRIRCSMYRAFALDFMGDAPAAYQCYRETLKAGRNWLGYYDYSTVIGSYTANLAVRGHLREMYDLLTWWLPFTDRAHDDFMGTCYRIKVFSSATALGLVRDHVAELPRSRQQLARTRDIFAHYVWHGQFLLSLLENDDVRDEADETIASFNALDPQPSDQTEGPIAAVAVAYVRARQVMLANESDRSRRREQLDAALAQLGGLAAVPMFRCHLLVLQASRDRFAKRFRRAARLLRDATDEAEKADSDWGRFEAARERARLAVETGPSDDVLRYGQQAREIARGRGWVLRIDALEREFSLDDDVRTSRGPSRSSAASMVAGHALREVERRFAALLEVSRASASSIDLEKQSEAVLDTLLELLGAERAFLFIGEGAGDLVCQAGRTSDGSALPEDALARTLVTRVADNREPLIVASTEEAELLGSESAVAHGLRSVMVAPLLQGDKLLGVLYVDSSIVSGLFTASDLELLAALSGQIALWIRMAAAARMEVRQAALARQLELTAAVQSLLLPAQMSVDLPKFALAAVYRPATNCGGDWWSYRADASGGVDVWLGDVTGHGPSAAMVTAAIAACHAMLGEGRLPPRGQLESVSETIFRLCQGRFRAAFVALVARPQTRAVSVLSAGAAPVLRFGPESDEAEVLVTRSATLGGSEHDIAELSVDAPPGTRLVIFTDGFVEQTLPSGRPVRMKRWTEMNRQTRRLPAEKAVAASLDLFDRARGDQEQDDDITVIVVDVK